MNTVLNHTGVAFLTNKSGATRAYGDVVVIDTTTASSFTTTTTSGFNDRLIGVVVEPNGIANNAVGMVAFHTWNPKITLNSAATVGQLIKAHTVAGQGTPHNSPMVAGDFAIALEASSTPKSLLFGCPVQSGGGGGGGSPTFSAESPYDSDDFLMGSTTANQIGSMGWNTISVTYIAATTGHPGVVELSATDGQNNGLLGGNAGAQGMSPADTFDINWVIKCTTSTGKYRAGLTTGGVGSDPPTDGIYLEKLVADSNWFLVTRSGSTQTRVDTAVAFSTANWVKFRLRRIDSSTIGAIVNAATEVTSTTNIPTAIMDHFLSLIGSGGTATVRADFWSCQTTGLTRSP